MAAIDSDPHALTIRASADPYGCFNRLRHAGYWAPAGVDEVEVSDDGFTRKVILMQTWIPNVMSLECRYDHSLTDPRCAGCTHAGGGERYSEWVKQQVLNNK